ncbi:creatininase family protein [Trichlorobacter ammonificans]|uniref:Creatininase n=1 Tax=Trichlorobacter ammonificans TaxID=2916410 RepID=A0ABM9D991_9BACT|nr:creatininase family protein [Trichlorobacter ammonificans]CAH2031788.1 Creatininase [Trichlorobacter ammonificans]
MILAEMTMTQVEEALKTCQSVVIPFGALEEHGPHLPLSTDTIQAMEVARRAAERTPLFVAPPVHYGNCRSTAAHPGTVSISTATLKALLKDIVRSLYRQGFRTVLALTGHAGGAHRMALQDAGEELLDELPELAMAVATEYELAREAGRGLVETAGDAHAGEIETSRILHSHPQLVRGSAPEEYPTFPVGLLVRDKRRYWPGGVWGNPAKASAEKGRLLEELVVEKVVGLVRRMEEERHG